MLTKLTVVIILQYKHVSNHYAVHLVLIQCYISIYGNKTGKNRKSLNSEHCHIFSSKYNHKLNYLMKFQYLKWNVPRWWSYEHIWLSYYFIQSTCWAPTMCQVLSCFNFFLVSQIKVKEYGNLTNMASSDGVCLPRSSLSIGKNSCIIALNEWQH